MTFTSAMVVAAYAMSLAPFLIYMTKKVTHPNVKAITPLIYLLAFSGLYEFIVSQQFKVDSTIWFKVYTLLEFICLYYFFNAVTHEKYSKLFKAYLWVFICVFVCLQLYWITHGNAKTDSSLTILETVFVYNAAFFWFRDIFTNLKLQTLWDSPAFYFISGFIMYFSGTFFLFVMTDLVFTTEEMNRYWPINVVLSLLLSIIITSGIWKAQQKSLRCSG